MSHKQLAKGLALKILKHRGLGSISHLVTFAGGCWLMLLKGEIGPETWYLLYSKTIRKINFSFIQ